MDNKFEILYNSTIKQKMKFILNAFVTKSDLEYDNSDELWAWWQQGQRLQQLKEQISFVIMLLFSQMGKVIDHL